MYLVSGPKKKSQKKKKRKRCEEEEVEEELPAVGDICSDDEDYRAEHDGAEQQQSKAAQTGRQHSNKLCNTFSHSIFVCDSSSHLSLTFTPFFVLNLMYHVLFRSGHPAADPGGGSHVSRPHKEKESKVGTIPQQNTCKSVIRQVTVTLSTRFMKPQLWLAKFDSCHSI